MYLEKNKENNEHKESNGEISSENKIEIQYEHDGENDVQDLDELEGNDLDEFELLSLFDIFDLIDIGIHDFIREVYFED
ncbi:hypothetical protein [Methanobrevibacter sp.]|uniref:hypothetical protein n=1 Tax=Methanobrevibacter sp. TaxID=66852 RepID=UPI0025F10376|nr:hypothetical protein [Methanobrevibacter sp.]MBQ2961787.1 hypothetical protein [Methanobrevibacter sp.]